MNHDKIAWLINQLQIILTTKTTTFVRRAFDTYCKDKGYPKWDWKWIQEAPQWTYSEYDCQRRLRTICQVHKEGHELNIALRKKAGYYFLIEYDRRRIFECDPDVLVLDGEKLEMVYEKYKELFDLLFERCDKPKEESLCQK